MKPLIIIFTKTIEKILIKLDKGSSFPGKIALKLNKNITSYFKLPKKIIFVTGTNGKTSTAGIIANIYTQNGYKVAHNSKGSNLENGIVSCLIANSNPFGKIKKDILVLEIDERYFKKVINYIKPNYLVISNLSRDQPPRNGHFDIVFNDINNYLTDDIHLILNCDDPQVVKFGLNPNQKVTYYGLAKTKNSKKENKYNPFDMAFCPKCNKRLIFDYFHYENLGNYRCSNCNFKRPNPEFEAQLIDDTHFKINDNIITMDSNAFYNVYNLTAGFAVTSVTKLEDKNIVKALNNLSLDFDRLETFEVDNKKGAIILSKNENSVSYNQSLDYINNQPNHKTIVIGFINVSRRYRFNDLSWLWDINFEKLNNTSIHNIICVGPFAYDIATRLKYAEISEKRILVCENENELLNTIKKYGQENIYNLIGFEMETILKKQIKEDVTC